MAAKNWQHQHRIYERHQTTSKISSATFVVFFVFFTKIFMKIDFTKKIVIYTWLCWLNGRPGIPRWSEPNPRCPRSWAIVCSTRYRLMSSEAAENWGSWDVVVWRSAPETEAGWPAPALPAPVISPGDPSPLLLFKGLMVVSGLALKAMKAALLASRLLLFWLGLWACGLWSWSTVAREKRNNIWIFQGLAFHTSLKSKLVNFWVPFTCLELDISPKIR